jgi:hypothetical protein
MGRSDPQGEEDDSVQQRNSQQTMHFWSDQARHLPTRPPAHLRLCLCSSEAVITFFAFSLQDGAPKRGNRRVLQLYTTIQRSSLLFLFLGLRYVIPPRHPRSLRSTYGYLPDCANLFGCCAPSTCIPEMPVNLAGGIHRDK